MIGNYCIHIPAELVVTSSSVTQIHLFLLPTKSGVSRQVPNMSPSYHQKRKSRRVMWREQVSSPASVLPVFGRDKSPGLQREH